MRQQRKRALMGMSKFGGVTVDLRKLLKPKFIWTRLILKCRDICILMTLSDGQVE